MPTVCQGVESAKAEHKPCKEAAEDWEPTGSVAQGSVGWVAKLAQDWAGAATAEQATVARP
jgi:hypothetical protein